MRKSASKVGPVPGPSVLQGPPSYFTAVAHGDDPEPLYAMVSPPGSTLHDRSSLVQDKLAFNTK